MNKTAVEILKALVGLKEKTGKNDGAPTLLTGGRQEPWCAHAVAYAHRLAGHPLPGDVSPSKRTKNPIALVATMERELKGAKQWVGVTDPESRTRMLEQLRPGALVFHSGRGRSDPARPGELIPQRHVDMFHSLHPTKDRTIRVYSGNWGDKLVDRDLSADDPSINGWANWPPIVAEPAPRITIPSLPPLTLDDLPSSL